MSYRFEIVVAAVGLGTTLASLGLLLLRPAARRYLIAASVVIAFTWVAVIGLTGFVWQAQHVQALLPGNVAFTAPAPPGGTVSCQLDVKGTADVKADADLWLYLVSERSGIYVQSGRPLREGPVHGDWSFPGMKIATEFYRGARYEIVATVVSKSQSAHTMDLLHEHPSDNWHLSASDFPLREQIVASDRLDVVLGSSKAC